MADDTLYCQETSACFSFFFFFVFFSTDGLTKKLQDTSVKVEKCVFDRPLICRTSLSLVSFIFLLLFALKPFFYVHLKRHTFFSPFYSLLDVHTRYYNPPPPKPLPVLNTVYRAQAYSGRPAWFRYLSILFILRLQTV